MNHQIHYLDGGMGTMLLAAGLPMGESPEMLNLTHPDEVAQIQRQYVVTGSEIIYANTFGANRIKAACTGKSVNELVTAAVQVAKKATEGTSCRVALDIGPIGKLLEPYGDLPFTQAVDIFKEMIVAGEAAGADLIAFETMADLYEVKAGLLAARECSKLPVFVTMTFEQNGRTYTGTSVESFAVFAQSWGVDALGVNCSLGPVELYPIVEKLRQYTNLPLIVKANAGLPDMQNQYHFTPEMFAQEMSKYTACGVRWLGGCCGTTPAHIAALIAATKDVPSQAQQMQLPAAVCTASQMQLVEEETVIGVQIDAAENADLAEELAQGEVDVVQDLALEQMDDGAELLQISVCAQGVDEVKAMELAVRAVQEVCNIPLVLCTENAQALEAGLRAVNGKAAVNIADMSDALLELIKTYGAMQI